MTMLAVLATSSPVLNSAADALNESSSASIIVKKVKRVKSLVFLASLILIM